MGGKERQRIREWKQDIREEIDGKDLTQKKLLRISLKRLIIRKGQ